MMSIVCHDAFIIYGTPKEMLLFSHDALIVPGRFYCLITALTVPRHLRYPGMSLLSLDTPVLIHPNVP